MDLFTIMQNFCLADKSRHWLYVELFSKSLPIVTNYIRSNSISIFVCYTGYMEMEINFKKYRLVPQTIIHLMKEHIIMITDVSEDFSGACVIMDLFQWRESRREVEQLAPLYSIVKERPMVTLKSKQSDLLKNYIDLFQSKYNNVDKLHDELISRKLIALMFYEIDRIYNEIRQNQPKQNRKERILTEFLHLVSIHFKSERRIEFYANHFQLTPQYLSIIIKQGSSLTAAEWINNYVITEAKILLRTTTKSIKEISDEMNFPDQSFFGKYFKLHTGLRPSQYRAKN